MEKSNKKGRILLYVVLGTLTVVLCILCFPLFRYMVTPDFRDQLSGWVRQMGIWGVLGLMGIQILQIVVAFIPGEPIELVAGSMYGAVGGLILCLLGILIGTFTIFTLVRKMGKSALERSSHKDAIKKYSFLNNEEKLETLIFILYFIPGTPKDILVYVCALTNIPRGRFLFLSTFARIPSVITSTLAGASFASGNYGITVLIFAITGVLGAAGIWAHNHLLKKKNGHQ